MTIRFVQQWNGYSPDTIVTLAGAEETRLIGLGYAVTDLDGPGNTPLPVLASHNPVTEGVEVLAVPLSFGPVVALLGDSILATDDDIGPTRYQVAAGVQSWAKVLSKQRFVCNFENNFAVVGSTSATVISSGKLDDCIASTPSACVVLIGTNDVSAAVSSATIIANLTTIYRSLLNAGIYVIAIPILPRSVTPSSGTMATMQKAINYVNGFIKRFAALNRGMYVADPWQNIVDMSNGQVLGGIPGGTRYAAYSYDGLHPSGRGGYWIGKAVSDIVNLIYPPNNDLSWSINDYYDATNNPNGNLLTNGFMNVASGGTAGVGASGVIPGTWNIASIGSAKALTANTVVQIATENTTEASLKYNAINSVITMGASPTTSESVWYKHDASGLTVGRSVYGEVEVEVVSSTADCLFEVTLRLQDGTIVMMDLCNSASANSAYLPNLSWKGVLKTQPFVLSAAGVNFVIVVQLDGTVPGATATIKISRAAMRYV